MKKRILAILLASFMLTTLLVGCAKTQETPKGKTEPEIVKIAYLPITHALPVFEEKELLEKQNSNVQIELVKYGSWPELLDALNTGRVDGASVLIQLAMKAKEQGVGLKAVALGHKDGNVIIVANDINSPADLKGKNFAIPHRQSSHNILLNDMLERAGIAIDELNVIELPPPEMPAALAADQIAGYCVAEPFGARAVSLGSGKALYQSGELWEDSLCCGLVLTEAFIDGRPETAETVIATYKEAGNQLKTEEAKRIAKAYLGQEEDVLDISLQWISYDGLDITEETYKSLADRVKKYGLSENPPHHLQTLYIRNRFHIEYSKRAIMHHITSC